MHSKSKSWNSVRFPNKFSSTHIQNESFIILPSTCFWIRGIQRHLLIIMVIVFKFCINFSYVRFLYSSSSLMTLLGYLPPLESIVSFQGHRDYVRSLKLLYNGEAVASVGNDGLLRIHSLTERRLMHSVALSQTPLSSVISLPCDHRIIVGSFDNSV